MNTPGISGQAARPKRGPMDAGASLEHYLKLILHRKWVAIATFLVVSLATVIVAQRLPNIYTSTTLILVDPQKVPEAYVKSTVTGDVRNRLGTLSQQILSFTRLQMIIESLNLYQEEKKTLTREEIISRMRKDITTTVSSDFGSSQDLQAFRITYSGKDPRLVAQVVNQLATLFIDENLKAREQQSSGTTEFLDSLLQESRKTLETQEAKVREFKMQHVGEMPEQLPSNLQISGQLQSQLQMEGEALARAEQQRALIQSMAAQTAPVVDTDTGDEKIQDAGQPKVPSAPGVKAPNKPAVNPDQAKLAELLAKGYKEIHPDIVKLRKKIAEDEAKQAVAGVVAVATPVPAAPLAPRPAAPDSSNAAAAVSPDPISDKVRSMNHFNPVLQAQIEQLDGEIAKHKQEQQRLSKLIAGFQARLELIPVREQQAADLERDYGISKAHYSSLLDKELSAETATQLELRQKGQKFVVLDPALPGEKPAHPNRPLIDMGGSLLGLVLGLLLTLVPEFRGASIIAPRDIATAGLTMLEMIPVIQTQADQRVRKWRMVLATATSAAGMLALCAAVAYHYRGHL